MHQTFFVLFLLPSIPSCQQSYEDGSWQQKCCLLAAYPYLVKVCTSISSWSILVTVLNHRQFQDHAKMFLMTKAGTVHIVQIVCLGWSSGLRAKCKFVTYCCIRVLAIKTQTTYSVILNFLLEVVWHKRCHLVFATKC